MKNKFHIILNIILINLIFINGKFLNLNEIIIKQNKLSNIINKTINNFNIITDKTENIFPSSIYIRKETNNSNSNNNNNNNNNNSDDNYHLQSIIGNYCIKDSRYSTMSSCCSSNDLKNLYNVKVISGKFIGYSEKTTQTINLSPLKSFVLQNLGTYSTTMSIKPGKMTLQNCTNYFDGTLHVIGRKSVNKLYHAFADNYIPMVSHILMDAWLNPSFLHSPRMFVFGRTTPQDSDEVKQMAFYYDLATAGVVNMIQIEGWCFKRVLWGTGPHPFMHINSIGLRRLTAKFARNHFELFYPTPFPKFNSTIKPIPENQLMEKLQKQFPSITFQSDFVLKLHNQIKKFNKTYHHIPQVVLYTRGDSGIGRTMAKEMLLLDILKTIGMKTHLCCDFTCNSIEQQIAFAYHSDIIIGLHGAALVHTLFGKKNVITIEMKSQYAYESYLFPLVSDGVEGIHGLVDTREYHSPYRGQEYKPGMRKIAEIDTPLLNRLLHTIIVAFELLEEKNQSKVIQVTKLHQDFVLGPSNNDNEGLNHVLGPNEKNQGYCLQLPLLKIQRILNPGKINDEVCRDCSLFHPPIFSRRLTFQQLRGNFEDMIVD